MVDRNAGRFHCRGKLRNLPRRPAERQQRRQILPQLHLRAGKEPAHLVARRMQRVLPPALQSAAGTAPPRPASCGTLPHRAAQDMRAQGCLRPRAPPPGTKRAASILPAVPQSRPRPFSPDRHRLQSQCVCREAPARRLRGFASGICAARTGATALSCSTCVPAPDKSCSSG